MEAGRHTLRDGSTVADPRLDRLPDFDERSRGYAAASLAPPGATLRGKTWALGWLLDQGEEGACTCFALAHNLLGSPRPKTLGADVAAVTRLARHFYGRAKQLDPWPGESYEGTSLLAALKAWREAQQLKSYGWAFGIDELLLVLGHVGPVVLATDWRERMSRPPLSGLLDISGRTVGGHAYDATGVVLYPERSTVWRSTGVKGEPIVVGPNSWGPAKSPREPARPGKAWGRLGYWAMRASDVETLLRARGEAAVPLDRTLAPA